MFNIFHIQTCSYTSEFNGIQAEAGILDTELITKELVSLPQMQRINIEVNTSDIHTETERLEEVPRRFAYTLAGCFLDITQNTTHCLQPWSVYVLSLGTISAFHNPTAKVTVITPRSRPSSPPVIHSADHSGSPTSITLHVSRPENPTTVIMGFHIAYRHSNGSMGSLTESINTPFDDQVTNPSRKFEIILPNLAPFTRYDLNLTAFSEEGVSPPVSLRAATDETVPFRMSPVNLVRVKGERFLWQVSWSPPHPLPGVIIRYELAVEDTDAQHTRDVIYSGLNTTVTVDTSSTHLRVRATTS